MGARIGEKTYKNNYSMDFNGSSEYMWTEANLFIPTTTLALCYWIKTENTNSLNRIVAQDGLGGASTRNWNSYFRWLSVTNRKVYWTIWDSGGSSNVIGSADGVFADGDWHHVACSFDGISGMTMYIDGVFENSGTTVNPGIKVPSGSGSQVMLGSNGSWHFDGFLKDVALWDNRELTQEDAEAIYNNGNPISLESYNPTVWYRLGDDENDYWNGNEWILIDSGTLNANITSYNMVENDRVEDYPGK